MSDSKVVEGAEEYMSHQVAGETVLMPSIAGNNDLKAAFMLSKVASRVWDLMGRNHTIAQIADIIAAEYGYDTERALAETQELMASFQAGNAVVSSKKTAGMTRSRASGGLDPA
jgi:hypothetical protein